MDHHRGRYVAAVRRYDDDEIGRLEWAGPRDMTCEIEVLRRTGLSVREHQPRTIDNFVELQILWGDVNTSRICLCCKMIAPPTTGDAQTCIPGAGIDLTQFPLVGIGSVCRRQGTVEVEAIVSEMPHRDPGLPMHVSGHRGIRPGPLWA